LLQRLRGVLALNKEIQITCLKATANIPCLWISRGRGWEGGRERERYPAK